MKKTAALNNHTIKSNFDVVVLPNLNTSGAEMAFRAEPSGAVEPGCRGPRGRGPVYSGTVESLPVGRAQLNGFPPTA